MKWPTSPPKDSMIKIKLNGSVLSVEDGATVADVVRSMGVDESASGVAVAMNDAVVARAEWRSRRLAAGDVVEIIHAVQGG